MDMFLFDFIFSVIFMAAKLDINSDISVVKSVVRFVNFKMFFSKKGIRNSQSNMQTFSISPQDRTKILSLQIRRDGTCVKKYFSLLAQGYTWASTSIQGFG